MLGREGLAGHRGRAELHAAAALGAGQAIGKVPPGQVLEALGPEHRQLLAFLRLRLEIHLAQRPTRLEVAEVDVRLAADDVEVLAVRQVGAKAEDEEDVCPGGNPEADQGSRLADGLKGKAQRTGEDRPGA